MFALTLLMLSVCSCVPHLRNPFSQVDHVALSRKKAADNLAAYRITPSRQVTGKPSLSLEDCRRLALTRNLDLQAARVDELTKAALRQSGEKKILPHLVFNAELSERDNYRYSFSDVLGREGLTPEPAALGTGVTNYSVGHERSSWRYSMELNWSPNDAALAYFLALNGGNDRLSSHYQKVRVAQKLVGTVEAAFFRLLGSEDRLSLARELMGIRSKALEEIERLLRRQMTTSEEYRRAKTNSIRASRLMATVKTELERQREILASAMGISPHCDYLDKFSVCGALTRPHYRECVSAMEMKAVNNRPEAYLAGLNLMTSLNDVKRSIIKCFPKIRGFWRYTRDKDRYLYNKDWKEVGLNINFDITEMWSQLDESRAAKTEALKQDRKTGVAAVTVASQVRSAALLYFRALEELENARQSVRNAEKYYRNMLIKYRADKTPELKLNETEADLIEERMAWKKALGEANAALAKLNEAMGVNYQQPPPKD
jgi:outer membrane protein TolC